MFQKVFIIVTFCLKLVFTAKHSGNVLVIIADDYGFESGAYGNPVIPTPNIDALTKQGVLYKNAYSAVSSCSPSRSAILTGLPSHQNGMYGLHNGYHAFNSFDDVKSLPFILKNAGIKTGIIGKKHVGPEAVYPFDFAQTEENNKIMQVGRNITKIRKLVSQFLDIYSTNGNFLLYVGFHDPHRCGHSNQQYGPFCEKFGNGETGMGSIPDWKPFKIDPSKVIVPNFVQDTPETRRDLAAQYTTISRLDQGVGLVLSEFNKQGLLNDTLIIFSSDNGIPFLNGRTNLYNSGIRVPFILSSPKNKAQWGTQNSELVSLLDITPTILDWFGLQYPKYKIFKKPVTLTGHSLLQKTSTENTFASHSLHEITMFYPMRSISSTKHHLIHNMNYLMPYPIDQDFFMSPSFQDALNRTKHGIDLHWFKTLKQYYYRSEWELFDFSKDEVEANNLVTDPNYKSIYAELKSKLLNWQNVTKDPFICYPSGILEDSGIYKENPQCFTLLNGLK